MLEKHGTKSLVATLPSRVHEMAPHNILSAAHAGFNLDFVVKTGKWKRHDPRVVQF